MGFDLNVSYDAHLDNIDELNGECSHRSFLRRYLFEQAQADYFAASDRILINLLTKRSG